VAVLIPDAAPEMMATLPASLIAGNSSELLDAHPVGSIRDLDFGVFAVANVATEDANAFAPMHLITRIPDASYAGLQRLGAPTVSLTRLARLPGWQSLPTGHLAPLWKGLIWRLSDRRRPGSGSLS
jgi:hypothetical protein